MPTFTAPRVMPAGQDDELWRTGQGGNSVDTVLGVTQAGSPQTPDFGGPRLIDFDAAAAAARNDLEERERTRDANQLNQPEIPQAAFDWGKDQDDSGSWSDRGKGQGWNLVPA